MNYLQLDEILNRVGKQIFIKYLEHFEDLSLQNKEVIALIEENFTEKSKNSRVSKARKAIKEYGLKEILVNIIHSKKLDGGILHKATKKLNDISSQSDSNIPDGITKKMILDSIKIYDNKSIPHSFKDSAQYDVIINDNSYPPKAIIGIASKFITRVLHPSEFSAGHDKKCFKILKELGFKIVKKDSENKTKITNYWIFTNNLNRFNSIEKFKRNSIIRWGNQTKDGKKCSINVGDIVYIYVGVPLQKIAIKTKVIHSNFNMKIDKDYDIESIEDNYKDDYKDEECVILELIGFIDNDLITLKKLQENGINGNIQGKITLKENALKYVLNNESILYNRNALDAEFDDGVKKSKLLTSEQRQSRLRDANKIPEEMIAQVKIYKRNPDVVVEVLNRANGICEECFNPAPFIRKSDNTPYLEVHHKILLSNGGEDTVDNSIAVCPNCHRRFHYGIEEE